MIAINLLYPQDGTPEEGVPSPVDLNGYAIAYRNMGLVPVVLTCPDSLIDLATKAVVEAGACRIIRAMDGSWFTIAQTLPVIGCRLSNSVNIAIPDSVETAVSFDTEAYDYGSLHSLITAKSQIVAMVAGIYSIGGCAAFAAMGPGGTLKYLGLRVNGTNVIVREDWDSAGSQAHVVTADYYLNVGDYVEFVAWQNSGGGGLNILASANYSPVFWAHLVR